MGSAKTRSPLRMLWVLFFLSGAAGLSYELVWMRLLGRYFGHTVHAVTTVLAAFMAGLALGSAVFGARADRTQRPMRLYGVLELGIGISCLLTPFLLELSRSVYVSLYPSLAHSLGLRTLVQFALAMLVLLVPTTLMGGTLPAVVKAVADRSDRPANDVALLYGTNTAGAASGAIAASYWLLPDLGIAAANHVGVAINLTIGALVLVLFRESRGGEQRTPVAPQPAGRLERVLVAGLFVSGAVAMTYQIVWTRSLILVIGSSTYAFGTILITFLLGLAAGSHLFRLIPRGNTPGFFAWLQVGVALSAFLLMPFFDHLPALFLRLFAGYDGSFAHILFMQFAVVGPFILLPTLFLGMVFPCVVGILSREPARVGQDVGRLYAYNTLGAIAGSALTGFVLIPWLGSQRTLAIAIALNLLIGAGVLLSARPRQHIARVGGLVLAALVPLLLPAWDRVRMSTGVSVYPRGYGADASGEPSLKAPFRVLFFREGISTTVAVTTTPQGGGSLRVNGKVDASTEPVDMLTQARLAYIPLLLHPQPRRVAIIGLGSGITAGTATLFDSVERVDVVELEPAVVEAAALFSKHNFAVQQERRVATHIDDARGFLEVQRGSYDVLISEPSNPWIAGVASLFSAEFMALVEDRLAPQGIFCQWLQTYSISPAEMRMVVRTFRSAFDDASLWRASPTDYLLIGRRAGSGRIAAESVRARLQALPRLTKLIETYGEHPVDSVWASFLLDAGQLRAYAGAGPLNTEDLLHLEFQAPRSLYVNHGADIDGELLARKTRSFPGFVDVAEADRAAAPMHLGQYLIQRQQPRGAAWFLQRAPRLSPFSIPAPDEQLPLWQQVAHPITRVHEDFEASPQLPLIPRVAGIDFGVDGSDQDRVAMRAAYELLFTRVSGVAPGMGLGGSAGLVLRWVPMSSLVGYAIPQVVKPSARYRVGWSMLNGALQPGEAVSVVVEQFDTVEATGMQFMMSYVNTHSVHRETMAQIDAAQPWTRHGFEFSTTPNTHMVHIVFFRSGAPNPEPVRFDDFTVEDVEFTSM